MGWRFVLSLIFAMLVALFAIQNADSVVINFVTWKVTVSQALVIMLSAILGAVIVMLLSLFKQIKMGSEIKYEKRNATVLQAENANLRTKLDEANGKLAERAAAARQVDTRPVDTRPVDTRSDDTRPVDTTQDLTPETEQLPEEPEDVGPKSWIDR